VGFVHVKDLFRLYHSTAGQGDIHNIVRKVSYVPETAPLKEVWNTLNREENYLAIVINEFGGTVGMVTREDLVEELFGEIRDEFDEAEEPLISPVGEHEYVVRGDAPITYLNTRFGLSLPAKRVHTVGGLVLSRLNRIPEAGDVVEINGVEMSVESVRDKAVETIRLRLPAATQGLEGVD
jgi:CBS domain containing-hemolysin-like protein